MMEAKYSQPISNVKEQETISQSHIENDTINPVQRMILSQNLVQRMILSHNLVKRTIQSNSRMILSHNLRNLYELFFYISYVDEHQMRGQDLKPSKCNYMMDRRRIRGRLKKNEQMPNKAKEKEGNIWYLVWTRSRR